MGVPGPPRAHFLVEWYRPAVADEPLDLSIERLIHCAASVSAAGFPVNLLATVSVPRDEVVFAIFDSVSEQSVAEVCRRSGYPAQRMSASVDARFWRAG